MEITESLLAFIALALWLGFVIAKSIRKNKKKYKRESIGEIKVKQYLAKYCKENTDAYVLHNLTLRLDDGGSTQIDHILITRKGVFVLETKHYDGWIFASPHSKNWTQVFYDKKYRFQNPLFQNYKHISTIKNLLGFLGPKYIYNIVVFSGNAVFKSTKPENVFYLQELIPALNRYSSAILDLNHIQKCVARLESAQGIFKKKIWIAIAQAIACSFENKDSAVPRKLIKFNPHPGLSGHPLPKLVEGRSICFANEKGC